MSRRLNIKNAFRLLHRWLGLTSGLVVFIVSLTGCIYVFSEEIGQLLESGVWMQVEPRPEPVAAPSLWVEKGIEAHKGKGTVLTQSVELYPQRSLAVINWIRDSSGYTAYIQDPWSGETLRTYKYALSFWAVIIQLHVSLAIPVVGAHIVSIATFIFALMMITGLILWWPKTIKASKPRLSFQWTSKSNWKRKTWDLHLVLGVYSSIALLLVAITGLAMVYGWVDKGIYRTAMAFSDTAAVQSPTPFDLAELNAKAVDGGADSTVVRLTRLHPNVHVYRLSYRANDSLYRLIFATPGQHARGGVDTYGIHRVTGKVERYRLAKDMNAGEFMHEANIQIHTGAFLGIPGKILAFIVSFIAATLPISGFLMWWGKAKSKRKPKPNKAGA
jgi:uncharacterized iron-regulated membrane protein